MYLLGNPTVVVPVLPGGCSLSFSMAFTFNPATGTPSGRRHYLFHGLNSDASYWSAAPFTALISGLAAQGDESVLFNLPIAATCFYTNGGWQYRDQFNAMVNAVMNAVELVHGPAAKNVVGGVSYGGLHAMLATSINGRFAAWWAHMTVTRVDALTELSGVGDAVRFNPQFEVERLAMKKGYISWGTADTRVNWTLTKAIADQLPGIVTKHEYAGLDHTTNTQGVSDILAYAGGL